MPHMHADTLLMRIPARQRGESRFARPVATVTCAILGLRNWALEALAAPSGVAAPRIRQDLEVRALEEKFAHAADHGELERMERAFDRREAEGVHTWDAR